MVEAVATFSSACARCKATITATITFQSTGEHTVLPAPVIGCYCECGDRKEAGGLNGTQAVPLTLRGDPA